MIQTDASRDEEADTAQGRLSLETAVASSQNIAAVSTSGEALTAPETSTPSRPSVGQQILAALREMLETVIFALLVFLLVQSVSRNYRVQSISMQPTLFEGQQIVVNRVVYADGPVIEALRRAVSRYELGQRVFDAIFHAPRRGEVIVFVPINNGKPDLIKRVIGIEGDKIEIRQGKLYINDRPIEEPYVNPSSGQSFGPVIVGKGELFVMGDNRGNSSDSRVFGMLPVSHVVGQAWLRYWPPDAWGLIRHYDLSQQLH